MKHQITSWIRKKEEKKKSSGNKFVQKCLFKNAMQNSKGDWPQRLRVPPGRDPSVTDATALQAKSKIRLMSKL